MERLKIVSKFVRSVHWALIGNLSEPMENFQANNQLTFEIEKLIKKFGKGFGDGNMVKFTF